MKILNLPLSPHSADTTVLWIWSADQLQLKRRGQYNKEAIVGPAVMGNTAKIICPEIKVFILFFWRGGGRGAVVDGFHTQQIVVKNRYEELG